MISVHFSHQSIQNKTKKTFPPKVFWPPFLIIVGVETDLPTRFYLEAEAQDSSSYHELAVLP